MDENKGRRSRSQNEVLVAAYLEQFCAQYGIPSASDEVEELISAVARVPILESDCYGILARLPKVPPSTKLRKLPTFDRETLQRLSDAIQLLDFTPELKLMFATESRYLALLDRGETSEPPNIQPQVRECDTMLGGNGEYLASFSVSDRRSAG